MTTEKITYEGYEMSVEYVENKSDGETTQLVTATHYFDHDPVSSNVMVGYDHKTVDEAVEAVCSNVVEKIEELKDEKESGAVERREQEFQSAVSELDESS